MIPLEKKVNIKGIGEPTVATLIKRTEQVAMYRRDNSSIIEVFRVPVAPEETVFGKKYLEREKYPTNNDFGDFAWCFVDIDLAEAKYQEQLKYVLEKNDSKKEKEAKRINCS